MTTYGSVVVGYSAAGVGHTVPVHETIDLAYFGITGNSTGTGTPTTSSAPSSSTTPASGGGETGTVPEWGQCGG